MSVSEVQLLVKPSELAPIFTLLGVLVAIWVLRENHLWNRRQEAAKLLANWSEKASVHRRAIEKIRPGLLDLIAGQQVEITKADAKAIYESNPKLNEDLWNLRFHFIELLNSMEVAAVCYQNSVVDRSMMDSTMKPLITRYHKILHNYIEYVIEQRQYNPWKPYSDLIDSWKPRDDRTPTAPPIGSIFSWLRRT